MSDSRTKNSIRNVFFGVGMKISSLLMTFVIRTIIVRVLGAEYAGLNSLFNAILNFLSLTELGFGSALVFSMYEPVAHRNHQKICELLNFYKKAYYVIGTCILVIGISIMPFLPKLVNGSYPNDINIYYLYVIYLFNTVISYFLFAYRGSLLVAFQRNDIQSKIMLVTYTLTSLIQICVLILFKNYYIYIIFNPIYTIAQNVLIGWMSKKLYPEIKCVGSISAEEKKVLFSKTIALTGHKIGGTIAGSLDSIVISSMLGLLAVGMYGNYYTILAALMGFINIGMQAVLPSIGNHLVDANNEEKYTVFKTLNFLFVWVVGWATTCLLVLFQDFIETWLGQSMVLSNIDMIWFCVYFYAWQFRVLGCNYKDAAGIWTEDVAKPYVGSIVNVTLNILLVKRFGISGALISTIICMIFIYFPWETKVLFKNVFQRNAGEYVLGQLTGFASWCVISVITYWCCSLIKMDNILLRLVICGSVCVILPNVLYILMNCKKTEFCYIVQKIKHGWETYNDK